MVRKLVVSCIVIVLVALSASASAISDGASIKQCLTNKLTSQVTNRQVYLGSASIIGDGNSSILEAIAKNNLLIGIDSPSGYVDFYISYNMNCSGATDEGVITLSISLNGQNISTNVVQTPTSKNGTLKIENVKVNRKDALIFVINVAYFSAIPLYSNSTSATGAGVFSRAITFVGRSDGLPFLRFLKEHSQISLALKHILGPIS